MMPIYNIGNSGCHPHAFRMALQHPGILVLHDVVLHHARLADFVQRGKGRDYVRLMNHHYGQEGERVANEILRGASLDLSEYPLSEDYLEASSLAVVHSDHARERVERLCPTGSVRVVPMGVPLPILVDRNDGRRHLDLPENAFIITSITHVNPMKRLHVVLRALRRVVERRPETLLIVAGSVARGMNLERQVSLLGLERHVRIVGYLSDDDSRILARAGDVSVNLRYPSAGETSASLLRLLGSARPVIVTAHGPSLELPDDVALRVPIDRLEEETLTEMLVWLADDDIARQELGDTARRFVERNHSMGAAVNGYRDAISTAFGVELRGLAEDLVVEHEPVMRSGVTLKAAPVALGQAEESVADALFALGLANHDGTIEIASKALVELGLDRHERKPGVATNGNLAIDPALLAVLACPVCKTPVRLDDNELVCDTCDRRYQIEDGIPIMLVENFSD
jgi:glycosyltransferase involved in cell wall biosynthesis/uncharacterized protein YbaR (Trm112 family)